MSPGLIKWRLTLTPRWTSQKPLMCIKEIYCNQCASQSLHRRKGMSCKLSQRRRRRGGWPALFLLTYLNPSCVEATFLGLCTSWLWVILGGRGKVRGLAKWHQWNICLNLGPHTRTHVPRSAKSIWRAMDMLVNLIVAKMMHHVEVVPAWKLQNTYKILQDSNSPLSHLSISPKPVPAGQKNLNNEDLPTVALFIQLIYNHHALPCFQSNVKSWGLWSKDIVLQDLNPWEDLQSESVCCLWKKHLCWNGKQGRLRWQSIGRKPARPLLRHFRLQCSRCHLRGKLGIFSSTIDQLFQKDQLCVADLSTQIWGNGQTMTKWFLKHVNSWNLKEATLSLGALNTAFTFHGA